MRPSIVAVPVAASRLPEATAVDLPLSTNTAATVEVDVMPFLGRTSSGGPFGAYYEALSGLGAEYVRFAPWFPNPRVVVTELTPPDCASRPVIWMEECSCRACAA